MNQEIYSILRKYNSRRSLLTEEAIKDIYEIILSNKDLQDYVKNIGINHDTKFSASYHTEDRSILVNPSLLLNKDLLEEFPTIYPLLYNADVVLSLFHEFTHAEQIKSCARFSVDKKDDFLEYAKVYLLLNGLCCSAINIFNISQNYYYRNHDKNPIEREANIKSLEDLCSLLQYMNNDDELADYCQAVYKLKTLEHYLFGYTLHNKKTNSPSIEYLNRVPFTLNCLRFLRFSLVYNKDNIPYKMRILYGLSLSSDEYKKLQNQGFRETMEFNKILSKLKR